MPVKRVSREHRVRREAEAYELINLSGTLRPELEERCRSLGITGYSRMNKELLKHAIIQKLFYDGDSATVEFESLAGTSYQCSQATKTALEAALHGTVPGDETLILTLFTLLDDALANGGRPETISEQTVIDKLHDAKRRHGWCRTADSCVREMGIDLDRGGAYHEGRTVLVETVKTVAQRYGRDSGLDLQVNNLLREMGITV